MEEQKPLIAFDEFVSVDLRVGNVIDIIDVVESEKLYRMTVDFGALGVRTIFAGLRKFVTKRQIKGKKFVFVYNLMPRKMVGQESQGMMLVIEQNDGILLYPAPKGAVEGAQLG